VLANEFARPQHHRKCRGARPTARNCFLREKTETQIKEFSKIPPLERLGQPEDVADVVSFLAGPDGGWVKRPGPSRQWRLCVTITS